MKKMVIIINGAGGVGKDTICSIVARRFNVKVISSIDPIKNIAQLGGWKYTDKSLAGRKLLSDLKLAFVEYNDLPNAYILQEYNSFLEDDNDILFVHIREPNEIKKFSESVSIACISLLVKSMRVSSGNFGNISDDCVDGYQYDYIYYNDKNESELSDDFMQFFLNTILKNQEG